jgi:hypothetical protein
MPQRVEPPKLRHDPLEECFIGKAHAISVHHHRVGAAHFDNPGMDACRRPAWHLRRNGVGQHHAQAVFDLMQYTANLCAEDGAVAGQRCGSSISIRRMVIFQRSSRSCRTHH